MDNVIFYGDYELIGHREIDFPMSYGRNIDTSKKKIFFNGE